MTTIHDEEFVQQWDQMKPLTEWFIRRVAKVEPHEMDDVVQVARIALFIAMTKHDSNRGSLSALFTGVFKRLLHKWVYRYRTPISVPVNCAYQTDHPAYEFLSRGYVSLHDIIELHLDEEETCLHTGSVHDEVERRITVQVLIEWIDQLPDQERQALTLFAGLDDEEPLPYSRVGERMGISRQRARQLVNRACERLRKRCLEEQYDG